MKLSVISFTKKGMELSESIADVLESDSIQVCLYTKCKACMETEGELLVSFVQTSLGAWTKEQMQERNALLFIGACGIAVRAIAPFLTDKLHDVPVLVMDEKGKYVIPILSGHVGGANELAECMAKKTGAEPVITTATDINQKFAVDVFAKRNGLSIVNKDGIAKVSAKVLAEKKITISIEPEHIAPGEEKNLPDGLHLIPYPPVETVDVVVTSEEKGFDTALLLKPKEYIIGLGCKRGKSAAEIEDFIARRRKEAGILAGQIFALASISQKSDEQGILNWCQQERVQFFTYTAKELQKVKGNFHGSSFVKAQMGVDNVCERAALKACGERGKLIAAKYAENGMTIAIAKREWRVYFYGE